ncbi:hypothetical protein D0N36_00695 [Hymenobacter lapidiphilus]|uniref:hypothetical protein n=1 Tax=Hymenobacter sp. CCM 8763 TaxID=2303334 RepID=UPI000E350A00|nr:hypothetical protein [Hymenobacter sp. CCM 8763]RFP67036.1 hypothetical protein D0N36_00695 [Hymenobacter sp. CCM 8763]
MKITLLRPLAAILLLTGSLAACNTGSEDGATNVEIGSDKKMDPEARRPNNQGDDSAASGMRPDTNRTTIRDQYENAADTPDRNRDGLAD